MAIESVQAHTYSPVKKAAKTAAAAVLTAGVVATGLAIGAKRGVFAQGKNPILNKVNPYLQKAGDFINTKVGKVATAIKGKVENLQIKDRIVKSGTYQKVKAGLDKIGNKIKGLDVKGKLTAAKGKIGDKVKALDIKGKFVNAKDSVANFFEKHVNPEKFN